MVKVKSWKKLEPYKRTDENQWTKLKLEYFELLRLKL
jgi:hypothetical protein